MKKRLDPWLDLDTADLPHEEWRSVVGYDGCYEVSNLGRIKSLRRYIEKQTRWLAEKIRKQSFLAPGFQAVLTLHLDGRVTSHMVMRLVGEAFLPPLQGNQVYFRKNGNPNDSRLPNISVGSESGAVNHRFVIGTRSTTYHDDTNIGDVSRRQAQRNYGHLDVFEDGTLVERECVRCHVQLPITDFYPSKSAAVGLRKRICKACALTKYSGVVRPGLIVAANELRAQGLKKCGRCHLVLGLDSFSISYRADNPTPCYNGYCRSCRKEYTAERQKVYTAKKQQARKEESARAQSPTPRTEQ